jgi:hypothetical protein
VPTFFGIDKAEALAVVALAVAALAVIARAVALSPGGV